MCVYSFAGHQYRLIDGMFAFDDAESLCGEDQGYILEIGSDEENQFIS